jgi:hypothetical protein
MAFAGWSGAQLLRVGLVATPFLEAMSEACVGWMSLQAAVIARSKLPEVSTDHPDHAFYRGKVFAAQHFAHWVVSTIPSRARLLDSAPASALEIDDAAFATV